MAVAGGLVNNPMVSAAAMQYGSEFAQRGQAYVDQRVNNILVNPPFIPILIFLDKQATGHY